LDGFQATYSEHSLECFQGSQDLTTTTAKFSRATFQTVFGFSLAGSSK